MISMWAVEPGNPQPVIPLGSQSDEACFGFILYDTSQVASAK